MLQNAMLADERYCSWPDHHLKAPRHSDKGLPIGQSELLRPMLVIHPGSSNVLVIEGRAQC